MDALGEPIRKICHRPEKVAAFLRKGMEETVAEDDIVKIAVSEEGLRKCVGERKYRILLNKADLSGKDNIAEYIAGNWKNTEFTQPGEALKRKNIIIPLIFHLLCLPQETAAASVPTSCCTKLTECRCICGHLRSFRRQPRVQKLWDHSCHPVRRDCSQSTRIRSPGPDQSTSGTRYLFLHADRTCRRKRIISMPLYRI